jgi:hypothetical protein
MGHIINPISFRLFINRLWDCHWFSYNNYEYNYLQMQQNNFQVFLSKFFNLKIFSKNGYLFSHSNMFYFSKYVDVRIYLYKTIYNLNFKSFKFSNFSKVISDFFYRILYCKLIFRLKSLFDFYFYNLRLLLIKQKWQLNSLMKDEDKLKDFYFLFYFFILKKHRFQIFFNVVNFFIFYKYNINMKNIKINTKRIKKRQEESNLSPDVSNVSILKLFFFFIKFKFWRKVSFFIKFFFYKFLKNKVYIRFCKINSLGVNAQVIGSYITKRLKQRFKVVELILPVIRNLKKDFNIVGFKFSFCGRFSREEMATTEYFSFAAVPFNSMNLFIDYTVAGVILKDSFCGIKIWLNKKKDTFIDLFFFSQNTIWKELL